MSVIDLFEKKIKPKCEAEGIEFKKCSEYHIQLKGIFIVNVYPTKTAFYIQGTQKKRFYTSLDELIGIALGETEISISQNKERRKKLSHKKQQLWEKSSDCFFCGLKLESVETATIEHKIPLSKGGSNRNDNLALSHHECNQARGNSIGVKDA